MIIVRSILRFGVAKETLAPDSQSTHFLAVDASWSQFLFPEETQSVLVLPERSFTLAQ